MRLLAGTAILLVAARSLPPWAPGRFGVLPPFRPVPTGSRWNLAT